MRRLMLSIAMACLAGCSSYQVAPIDGRRVDVLYSVPARQYEVIGTVSAKRYKPGWSDPTVSDALPQLQAAGAEAGADAVIVRSSQTNGMRYITVEAEAIRYLK